MKEEKGKWEKIIRSKLYDFEVNVIPDDWDIISGKLPGKKSVRFHFYRRYSYVAAAITALLIVGGLYFYLHNDQAPNVAAVVDNSGTDTIDEKTVDSMDENSFSSTKASPVTIEPLAETVEKTVATSPARPPGMRLIQPDTIMQEELPERLMPMEIDETDAVVRNIINIELAKLDNRNKEYIREFENIKYETTFDEEPLIADASLETMPRRWGFGMGGGSYAVNPASGNVISNNSFLRSSDEYIRDEEILKMKEEGYMKLKSGLEDGIKTRSYEIPTGKNKHKTPVSIGLGVSYYLNNRWSLQSGVTYTILRSEWSSNNIAGELMESKQNLHYIGIPLSISYRIAEWNRFQLYASTGSMCEFNIAGIYKETIMSESLKKTNSEHLRMKTPMWSVNARSGINYPLWKFINVYVEAGASYYFDNKSEIKTIRSDKPFNVSLQAGIRFGF
ncbi:MAG: PorT family protein [Tannerella sp.]|jgi:hypothetical protein|nr:PorT family protein [Tannerella sp.]